MADTLGPDIILRTDDGAENTYTAPAALRVDNTDGGTTDFVNQNLIEKLPEVTEADNGKVFGVVDGQWQVMEAPAGGGTDYVHPETHSASMITGLAPVATEGNYDSLYGAPVGRRTVVPLGSYRFSPDDSGRPRVLIFLDEVPAVGSLCDVTWEGGKWSSRVRPLEDAPGLSAAGGYHGTFLGNPALVTMDPADDTAEPFLFLIGSSIPFADAFTGSEGRFNVHVSAADGVRRLPAEYLPEGIATEQFVRDAVAAGGGGGAAFTETELLPEQDLAGFVYDEEMGMAVCEVSPAPFTLELGKEYTAEWDGTAYTCTAQDLSAAAPGAVGIGNTAFIGGENTGEPFAIAMLGDTIAFVSTEDKDTHTVRICRTEALKVKWKDVLDKPFGEEAQLVTLIPEDSYTLSIDLPEEPKRKIILPLGAEVGALLQAGGITGAVVTWDGVTYELVPQFAGSAMAVGGNGMPFSIVVHPAGTVGAEAVALVTAYYDTVDPNEPTMEHTFSLTVQADGVKKLDRKYLPGPPEFDLAALGLPEIPLDGETVTAECDTAELMAAMEQGPVKIRLTLMGTQASSIVSASTFGGGYQAGQLVVLGGAPRLLSVSVGASGISAVCMTLAVQ